MKKPLLFFSLLVLFTACDEKAVKTPEKLIDKDQMAEIIYDVAILDAMRSRNPGTMQSTSNLDYIYKKYKIDSLQFAQNNTFYASDIKEYKKIYEKVNERLEREKKVADSLAAKSKTGTPSDSDQSKKALLDSPQIQ